MAMQTVPPARCLRTSRASRPASVRRGAAAVEFSLIIAVLVLFLMAAFEFSRVSMLRHSADNSAYEGARHAIVPGATVAEAEAAARDLLDRAGIEFAQITVSPNPILEQTTSVRVEVEVPITQNSWVLPRFMGEAVLRSDITLLTERSPLVQIQGLPEPPPPPPPPML